MMTRYAILYSLAEAATEYSSPDPVVREEIRQVTQNKGSDEKIFRFYKIRSGSIRSSGLGIHLELFNGILRQDRECSLNYPFILSCIHFRGFITWFQLDHLLPPSSFYAF